MFSSVMITEWNFLIWSLNAPLVMKSRLHSEQEWLGGTNPSPCILAECSRSLCMRVKPLPEFFLKKSIHYFVLLSAKKITYISRENARKILIRNSAHCVFVKNYFTKKNRENSPQIWHAKFFLSIWILSIWYWSDCLYLKDLWHWWHRNWASWAETGFPLILDVVFSPGLVDGHALFRWCFNKFDCLKFFIPLIFKFKQVRLEIIS